MNNIKSIKDIKNLRKGNKDNLNTSFENDEEQKDYEVDERFFKLECDDNGKGKAIIRFLPSLKEGKAPWVKLVKHKIFNQATKNYYNELSLTTLGQADPADEMNKRLYKQGDKTEAAKFGKRIEYVSNILVVKDEKNPDNEGKVFLFAYGKKIFETIKDTCIPVIEDEEGIDIFDYFDGADFYFISKDNGPDRYSSSKFRIPKPISDDEQVILDIANAQYNLEELLDESNYKTYEQLEARLHDVLGVKKTMKKANGNEEDDEDE